MKDFPRDFKIAFATVPKVTKEQANFKYPGGLGDVISINPNSKNKEQAWKFLKWYADGGMMPLAAGGRIPSSKERMWKKPLNCSLETMKKHMM